MRSGARRVPRSSDEAAQRNRGRHLAAVSAGGRLEYCPPPGRCSGWADGPPGSALRRISSSWARAAICWANSAVWMPWKTPSSQPTSWAWAIRSSASVGVSPSVNGRVIRSSSSRSSGARPCSSSRIDDCVDVAQPVAARLVEGRRPDLLEQLLDHRADPHDLGRLLDHLADVERAVVAVVVLGHRHGADRLPVRPHDDDLLRTLAAVPGAVMPPSCPVPGGAERGVRIARGPSLGATGN